ALRTTCRSTRACRVLQLPPPRSGACPSAPRTRRSGRTRPSARLGDCQFRDERGGVVGLIAQSAGDVLARGLRSLGEERAEDLAGLRAAPPVRSDLLHEMRAKLRVADPGAQVVGRVEAGIHV